MKPRRRVRWSVLAFCLAAASPALVGCGGGGDSAEAVPLDQYGARLMEIVCERGVFCGYDPDLATCLASQGDVAAQFVASVKAGRATYNPVAAGRCLARQRQTLTTVSCAVSGLPAWNAGVACDPPFKPAVADGAPCFSPLECVSGSCKSSPCTPTSGGCCAGTCNPTPPGGVSLPAYVPLGQPCNVSAGDMCAPGSMCVSGSALAVQGTCALLPAAGASCTSSLPCDDPHDYCDPTSMRCAPRIAVGAPCPAGAGCVVYARCDSASMICVARGATGEICDSSDAASCLSGLQCTNAACALPPAAPVCM